MEKDYSKYNNAAELLKVLAHPVRLCIVAGLLQKGECNVMHMTDCLDCPQSTISQHLQKLRMAGIIEGTRNGTEIKYKVCNKTAEKLMNILCEEIGK